MTDTLDRQADRPTTLAVDGEGGDFGPSVMVPAAVDLLRQRPSLRVLVCGRPQTLTPEIEAALSDQDDTVSGRLELVPADSVIGPQERAMAVLRRGQGSSLWVALTALAEGRAEACVSAGNTVAQVALGMKLIGTIPGIRRPALMSHIPTARGVTNMLDLGANLEVEPGRLLEFALMGTIAYAGDTGDHPPRVGLLNVGQEDSKGHSVVREAHELLRQSPLNYAGFIEGHDLFDGTVEVAVCDGFTGNLVLKSSEGLAALLLRELRDTIASSTRAKLGAALAGPALRGMLARLDPGKHNGAPLLGLDGVVIKSHGRADRAATVEALREAEREVRRSVPARIRDAIHRYQEEKLL